jgi:hypothetical protein
VALRWKGMAAVAATTATLLAVPQMAHAGPAYFHRDGRDRGPLDLKRVGIGYTGKSFVVSVETYARMKARHLGGNRRVIGWGLDTKGDRKFDYVVVLTKVRDAPVCALSPADSDKTWFIRIQFDEDRTRCSTTRIRRTKRRIGWRVVSRYYSRFDYAPSKDRRFVN